MRKTTRMPKRPAAARTGVKATTVAKAATHGAGEVPPRIVRRERRRERSREEIVDATRRVILQQGLGGTTLEAVAAEVGLTKAALYYYYPSKDALLFELVYETYAKQARAIESAVGAAERGGDALRAIIRETIAWFGPRLDDFRLAFLHNQVAGPDAVKLGAEHLARVRPLNDIAYGGATKKLADTWKQDGKGRARVEPRLMAFLAHVTAIGILTMKGMVEAVGDPLLYSDEQLADALARIFEAAAAP